MNGRGTGCRIDTGIWELDEEPPVVASRPTPEPAAPATPASARPAPDCSCPEPAAEVAEPAPFADYTLPARAEF